jgi:hypothetical protein
VPVGFAVGSKSSKWFIGKGQLCLRIPNLPLIVPSSPLTLFLKCPRTDRIPRTGFNSVSLEIACTANHQCRPSIKSLKA